MGRFPRFGMTLSGTTAGVVELVDVCVAIDLFLRRPPSMVDAPLTEPCGVVGFEVVVPNLSPLSMAATGSLSLVS